ncbi:putative signal transduction protein with Nacht domain [Thalassoporum mexicanum PCC 7367]|uniref:NACHT domain-containing protein n=1 Tax=Thalassoporum mexicanum TaxID=3457544 RepID=UPI00029FE6E0|nr:NACHT domain-containing protein [Pseudanabaena sp. PCC 7367]AFY71128.1 putative signal transduction protein with Nacht domain [Pseudanabaena sp. PCC 7367]
MEPISTAILTTAAVGGLSKLITNVIANYGEEALKRFNIDLTDSPDKVFARQFETYIRKYDDRHGSLKVACVRMDQPISLDEVYTGVRLLRRSDLQNYFESPDGLQKLFRESGKRQFRFEETETRPGLEVANEQQRLLVLGAPGIGKSTFLRKVGLEALKQEQGSYEHILIPVFLELKQFKTQDKSIEDFIANEFRICGFPNPEIITKYALEAGKLLVLLDGLDEVPKENEDFVIQQIQDLIIAYDQNRFIASCRIAAYKGGFERFTDVVMAEFDEPQIRDFIGNWFKSEPEVGEDCWKLLKQDSYKSTLDLAQTPLLLTLLCVVYGKYTELPKQRAELYGEALDVLLREWAAGKRLKLSVYKHFTAKQELILLSKIAYESFSVDELFFSKNWVVEQIEHFLAGNLNAPQDLDGESALKAIEVQQGILVERARNAYSFSHLTFQEYLVAKYVESHRLIEILLTEHFVDRKWREIFLLVAGLMEEGADLLLLAMEKQIQKFAQDMPKLQKLLVWSEKVTRGSRGKCNANAKRSAAILFALHTDLSRVNIINPGHTQTTLIDIMSASLLASMCGLGTDLELHTRNSYDLATAIKIGWATEALKAAQDLSKIYESINIFNESINLYAFINLLEKQIDLQETYGISENATSFLDELHETIKKVLHLTTVVSEFSEEEREALAGYLYANQLMIECKDSAIYLSTDAWKQIEDRMLLPPD